MRTKLLAITGVTGLVISILMSAPSGASATDRSSDQDARAVFEALAPDEIVSSIASPTSITSTSNEILAKVGDSSVSVESDLGTVTMAAPVDSPLSEVVPVLMDEGSALFAIVIEDSAAPQQYRFEFSAPDDTQATIAEDGSVAFRAAGGDLIAGLAKPWARDAREREIPTWFSLEGPFVIQHVDLSGVSADSFPVVADPWLGQQLVSSAWVTNQGGSDYVVNSVPTSWGRQYIDITTHSAHVAELKQKLGSLANKVTATIDNQFICHVVNNGFGGGATYNMESWRPNIHWTIQSNPITKCNP